MTTAQSYKLKMIVAFASVYIIWGSTYLAILYAIETIPPWFMSSMRFFIACIFMAGAALLKREARLSREEKKIAAISGIFLVAANGVVCVMEKWIPSGIAAVVIGAMPIWVMLIGWVSFGTGRPELRKILGACIGLIGIGLITSGDTSTNTTGYFGRYAPLVLCISSFLWASGTLYQRKAGNVKSGFSFLTVQMVSGAAVALLLSLAFEAPFEHDWSSVSAKSSLSFLYLIVFGSLIGFTSYSWLSRNVEPHLVSTYALVNPVIAVGLGWFLVGEPLTGKFLAAVLLVVLGLAVLMMPTRDVLKTILRRR